jgi:hypothetical protein
MDEMKMGAIFQSIGGNFRYHIYQTTSIESLENKQIIGVANSYQEACEIIKSYLAVNSFHQDSYWRLLLGDKATFIDYGSWTKFMAIVPPVSNKELGISEVKE